LTRPKLYTLRLTGIQVQAIHWAVQLAREKTMEKYNTVIGVGALEEALVMDESVRHQYSESVKKEEKKKRDSRRSISRPKKLRKQ
jgi:hypothetical protein